jgi:hypothetical protein
MVEKTAGNLEASPHPPGKCFDNVIFPVFQLNEVEELGDPLLPHLCRDPVEPPVKVHVFPGGEFFIKALVLEDNTNGFPDPVLITFNIVAIPEVGLSMVESMERVVVFPAPLGPSRPKISPCSISKDMLSTATRSLNRRVRFSIWIATVMR